MFNGPGYSVYLSNFELIKNRLPSLYREGGWIFTSFHVSEEMDETYVVRAGGMCRFLRDIGYKILADVSPRTLEYFGCRDIVEFAERMGASILRLDCGYTAREMAGIAGRFPICLNASTISPEEVREIGAGGGTVCAMHNFYPRPETGLDGELFDGLNRRLREAGARILAFVPGDGRLRGPLGQGLPTLEAHRGMKPYPSYLDMKLGHGVDGVFVGDGIMNSRQAKWIQRWEREGVITLPAVFHGAGELLYDRVFTIRRDSPRWLKRFQESREYSCFGERVEPNNPAARPAGSVTVDNERYLRYSGEVQLIIEDLPRDDRVNVAGTVCPEYMPLLNNVGNGARVVLERPD